MIARRHQYRSYSDANHVLDTFRADFEAAKVTRFNRRRTGVSALGSGADYHYRNESDYLRIQEYARDMDRNDMVIGSIVDRAVANIVQDGFRCEPDTGDEKLDNELKARWLEERDDPLYIDHDQEKTFPEFERLVLRDVFVAGDIFLLPTTEGLLQVRESHRCRSPGRTPRRIVHGVELERSSRRRLGYWFTKEDLDPFYPASGIRSSDLDNVDAWSSAGERQVLHVYNPTRFSQTRGISAFAPIFSAIGMHDDIEFATLLQRQLVSAFGWVEKRNEFWMPEADDSNDLQPSYDESTGMALEDVHPGMIVRPPKGVDLEAFSANVPGSEFFPHVKLILTFIGINLGFPLVMVLMDASETNFSGFRGAIDQARLGFRCRQSMLAAKLHRPVWQHRVRIWSEDDPALAVLVDKYDQKRRRAEVNPFCCKWHAPSWPYIQPQEDATANMIRLATGQTTRRRLNVETGIGSSGDDFEANTERAMEIRSALALARDINQEFGIEESSPDYVRWWQIATLPMPDQIRLSMTTATSTSTSKQEDLSNA